MQIDLIHKHDVRRVSLFGPCRTSECGVLCLRSGAWYPFTEWQLESADADGSRGDQPVSLPDPMPNGGLLAMREVYRTRQELRSLCAGAGVALYTDTLRSDGYPSTDGSTSGEGY